jgi:hypothetical protein
VNTALSMTRDQGETDSVTIPLDPAALRIRVNDAPGSSSEEDKSRPKGNINSLMSSDISGAGTVRRVIVFYVDVFLNLSDTTENARNSAISSR